MLLLLLCGMIAFPPLFCPSGIHIFLMPFHVDFLLYVVERGIIHVDTRGIPAALFNSFIMHLFLKLVKEYIASPASRGMSIQMGQNGNSLESIRQCHLWDPLATTFFSSFRTIRRANQPEGVFPLTADGCALEKFLLKFCLLVWQPDRFCFFFYYLCKSAVYSLIIMTENGRVSYFKCERGSRGWI